MPECNTADVKTSHLNCWEFMRCPHHPENDKVCPAAQPGPLDGSNDGFCGGRICWRIEGTFCHGQPVENLATKMSRCLTCTFFRLVHEQQGPNVRD